MTEDEALHVLGIDDPEEAEDACEEAMFELQKFIISNPVLLKTFQSRLKKAQKSYEAFSLLSKAEAPVLPENVTFETDSSFIRTFHNYHEAKNRIRKLVSGSYEFPVLENLSYQLIDLERKLAGLFVSYDNWTDEEALVSKDPDPMYVLGWLREVAYQEDLSPDILYSMRDKLDPGLRKALKRLSLLPKYLYE